jgi:hypothetical protein
VDKAMPEKTIKRRLQDAGDAALASDDGPIFSAVAKLVEALKRSIPEGTETGSEKKKPCASDVNCFAGPSAKKNNKGRRPTRMVAALSPSIASDYSTSFSDSVGCALGCDCGVPGAAPLSAYS